MQAQKSASAAGDTHAKDDTETKDGSPHSTAGLGKWRAGRHRPSQATGYYKGRSCPETLFTVFGAAETTAAVRIFVAWNKERKDILKERRREKTFAPSFFALLTVPDPLKEPGFEGGWTRNQEAEVPIPSA